MPIFQPVKWRFSPRCERIHLLLIGDARRGLEGITAGRTCEADAALAAIQKRRTSSAAPGGVGAVCQATSRCR